MGTLNLNDWESNFSLADLTSGGAVLSGFERIDLRGLLDMEGESNTLTITAESIQNLESTETYTIGKNKLTAVRITGDDEDTVILSGDDFGDPVQTNVTIKGDSAQYDVYEVPGQNPGEEAMYLLLQTGLVS